MKKIVKRVLSVRIDENTIDRMNYFCGALEVSQPEFVSEAIKSKCDEDRHLMCGGGTVTIPNPQFMNYTEEEAIEVVQILSDTANKLTNINPSLDFGLNEITTFAIQRLFKDSKEQKDRFCKKICSDFKNTNYEEE